MRYTLQEKGNLYRVVSMDFGRLTLLAYWRVREKLEDGPVQTPKNFSYSDPPAIGIDPRAWDGLPIPPGCLEDLALSMPPWNNGDPQEDGDGGD